MNDAILSTDYKPVDARARSSEPRVSACVLNIRSPVRKQDVYLAYVNARNGASC